MLWKYAVAWLGMVVLAITNAAIRETAFKKGLDMNELRAHQLSTFTGIILFGVFIWFVTGRWKTETPAQAVKIGLLWLVMTVAFEFLAGHFLFGNTWSRLLHDYNLLAGRVWILVLAWVALAPWLFHKIRR